MKVLDRNQQQHDVRDLNDLLVDPNNRTIYDAGILRTRDMFMLVDRGKLHQGSGQRWPTFCSFNSRFEELDRKKYLWDGGRDSDVPWLGVDFDLYDTANDKYIPEKAATMTRAYEPGRIARRGANTKMILNNVMRIGGLSGNSGRGGMCFETDPSGFTINLNSSGAFTLPSHWILAQDPKYKSTQDEPRKKFSLEASHMYIGFDSIMEGLDKGGQMSDLRDHFGKYFANLPKVEQRAQEMYDQSHPQLSK